MLSLFWPISEVRQPKNSENRASLRASRVVDPQHKAIFCWCHSAVLGSEITPCEKCRIFFHGISQESWEISKRSLKKSCTSFLHLRKWIKLVIGKCILFKLPPPPILNSIIIFTHFCRCKKRCNFYLNLFSIFLEVLQIFRENENLALSSKGDFTPWNRTMAPTKNKFTLPMNYSTCTESCMIFWIFGLPNFPCEYRLAIHMALRGRLDA